jgi:hypothetical protein
MVVAHSYQLNLFKNSIMSANEEASEVAAKNDEEAVL